MGFLTQAESIFSYAVQICILICEAAGVVILMISVVKSIIKYIRRDGSIRLELAQGIALALGFKMGSELLRTVIVRDLSELAILGAIILLRGAMTFLIHWEIKNEERRLR